MFTIRDGQKADSKEIAEMIAELARYYNRPGQPKTGQHELEEYAFCVESDKNIFRIFVAELDETKQLIGYALYYDNFTSYGGRGVWMEDLFVKQMYHGQGVGAALLKSVVKHTSDKNYDRLEWNTKNTNQKAIDFYKICGAINITETMGRIAFRMNSQELAKFLSYKKY